MTTAELEANLAMLRRQGVSKFVDVAGGGFEVEFFQAAPEGKSEPQTKPMDECKCGHRLYEHSAQGLCILGCDPLKCSPDEK